MLRSIRFGEADRVLHLYSADRGQGRGDREGFAAAALALRRPAGAVLPARPGPARGARRALHGDLCLHGRRARDAARERAGAGRGGARLRRGPAAARRGAAESGRLQPALPLPGAARRRARGADLPAALAFRLKLALVAGFAPELGSCARCGEGDGLVAFSGAAGGVVCGACEHGGFEIGEEAQRFMVEALGRPLTEAPSASPPALRQVERAISETLEHHAHVRLRAAA